MLVDTGADDIVLPLSAMHALEIAEEECEPLRRGSLFGMHEGFRSPALVLSFPDVDPAGKFSARVIFTDWLEGRPYGLLGREPTLDHMSFRFGHAEGYGFFVGFGD